MTNSERILTVENLSVAFDGNEVIKNLSFSVDKGDALAIVGPNGAGKSVLLKAALGLIPHSGKAEWKEGIKISYAPQKFYIDKDLPLSVEEFLKFKNKDMNKVIDVLEAVGIPAKAHPHMIDRHHLKEHIAKQRVGLLSGGQLQRILVAWSLLDNPDVLLFDEPTAGIDVGGEETIYKLLKKLKDERNLTILLVSHDLNVVFKYATNVMCINKEMICYGTPATVLDPASLAKLYGGEISFYKHDH